MCNACCSARVPKCRLHTHGQPWTGVEAQARVEIQVYQVQPSAISLCFIIPAPFPITFC